MQTETPTFTIYYPDAEDDSSFLIKENKTFHNYVLNFIQDRLDGAEDYDNNILCLFKVEDSDIIFGEAKLELSGYLQSLETCLKFFTEAEEYEKCKTIVKLQEIIKLQENNEQ